MGKAVKLFLKLVTCSQEHGVLHHCEMEKTENHQDKRSDRARKALVREVATVTPLGKKTIKMCFRLSL